MNLKIVMFLIILILFWLFATNIILDEYEKKNLPYIYHIDVKLTGYKDRIFGGGVIMCDIKFDRRLEIIDKHGEYRGEILNHIDEYVRIYYKICHTGILFSKISDQITGIEFFS